MDSTRILAIVLLCLINTPSFAVDPKLDLDLNAVVSQAMEAETIQEVTVGAFANSNFRSNGLLLDTTPSAGVNAILIAPETSPTIFSDGRWFATAAVASINAVASDGKRLNTVGSATVGMFGRLLPDGAVYYAWGLNRGMTNRADDFNSAQGGLYLPFSKSVLVGAEIKHSLNAPGDQFTFHKVFGMYEFIPDTWVKAEHGWQDAVNNMSGYHYNELSLRKDFTEDWTVETAYFFVESGKDFNSNLTRDGLQVKTRYRF